MEFGREVIAFLEEQTQVKMNVSYTENGIVEYFSVQGKQLYFTVNSLANPLSIDAKLHAIQLAEEKSYKHIHLSEDEWTLKKEVLKSRLCSLLGQNKTVFARKGKVRKITQPTLNTFLEENHLQVPTNAKYKYGLYIGEELYAVMSFSKPRPLTRNGKTVQSYELIRHCNKLGYTVTGGMSKLLKHFIREVQAEHIMSYVDRDWSDGGVYEKLGFQLVKNTEPIFFWVNPETGERYYSHKINREGISFEELERSFVKVCNSGSLKYVMTLEK